MEWLRTRPFLNKQPKALLSTEEECDPQACYDSFKQHWQQALKIILRTQHLPSHDDVLGVVNHLEQMVTLLIYDIKKLDQNSVSSTLSSRCLDYLLNENILQRLFDWGMKAGQYINAVRCEQLKIYEMLLSQSRNVLLVHEPFLKPMLNLLNSCQGELFSKETEKFLVDLLYQLCALLMQNVDLIDLFFQKEPKCNRFIIFILLIPFVHREDSIGMRARDALLLCMSMSRRNQQVAVYIVEHSNFAVLIASGLSGLYSVLPNMLDDITAPDWHLLTPDDVNDVKGLSIFVTSLEFSNAVAQIAHSSIRRQLQEFMYRGFLIPVLGPALLQNSLDEQVASMAYFELIIRTVSEPGLLYSILQFILKMEYDGERLLSILIKRIASDKQLSLLTLSLFNTIVDLNCEDLMLELVFQHLQPCLHLMLSQRSQLGLLDPHCQSLEKFLSLSPVCVELNPGSPRSDGCIWNHYGVQSLCGKYNAYLSDARNKITSCQMACSGWHNSYSGHEEKTAEAKNTEVSGSFPLSSESIGYGSLKTKIEDFNEESTLPFWQISANVKPKRVMPFYIENEQQLTNSGTAGLFLTLLLEKLNKFLSNSFYINLHLTGLISRLAVYSQPLLRSYLLDHSLVLQPNVPSLFQIIGALKQKIDEYMGRQTDCRALINYARDFLVERETRLINARRHVIEHSAPVSLEDNGEHFQRNGPKRRSLNLPSFSTMFARRPSHVDSSVPLVIQSNETQLSTMYPKFNECQHVALCAVLLDEWVKELAALAQEHTIAQLATLVK